MSILDHPLAGEIESTALLVQTIRRDPSLIMKLEGVPLVLAIHICPISCTEGASRRTASASRCGVDGGTPPNFGGNHARKQSLFNLRGPSNVENRALGLRDARVDHALTGAVNRL